MKKLFGTDGARGVALSELSCPLAYNIGCAAAITLGEINKNPKVVIGCDTRASSETLAMSVMSGLCAYGASPCYIGTVSTPCVSYITQKYKADAGIMISASHNTWEYNGIKIFSEKGIKLSDELEEKIEQIVYELKVPPLADRVGKVSYAQNAADDYISYLASLSTVPLKDLRLGIDCANGSASVTAEKLFTFLGASATVINASPSGYNINKNCGSTHIEHLRKTVVENNLDAGIAFDGDADRCIMIDENGNTVDGDSIMAICALDMKNRRVLSNSTLVATVMSNFGLMQFCKEHNITISLTAVGDRYVSENMRLSGNNLGGEQSGHIIFGDHASTGDGQLTALMVLGIMKREGKKLSELASVMKRYPQSLINLKVTEEQKLRFKNSKEIEEKIKAINSSLEGNGRLLVRLSGTEPLLRIMAEAQSEQAVSDITKELAEFIEQELMM